MTLFYSTQINTEQELNIFAEKLVNILMKGSIVLLSGGLSAGKTTLVANFCKVFGIQLVQSPTYSIHHRYSSKDITIDHFDLYRLESEEDIESSGFYDLLNTESHYKFIEWPDRIKTSDYPQGVPLVMIQINLENENVRLVDLYRIN